MEIKGGRALGRRSLGGEKLRRNISIINVQCPILKWSPI
jgi:hypothetical protein